MPSISPPSHPDAAPGWFTVLASSGVLSLALLGDALIYAVLPVHAAAFGVSIAWVGILLSANRFIRVFAYGWVAQLSMAAGLRNTCIGASAASVIATGAYGLAHGEYALLAARLLWGLAYAALLLATLAYAAEHRAEMGARIGWSRTVQRLGPIAALLVGGWLTGLLGPRTVFVVLAGVSLLAVALAWRLPRDEAPRVRAPRTPSLGRPSPVDLLFFLQGFGVDGVFALSITIILAREHSLSVAVLSGGALLAMRHLSEAVAAPLFGTLADRHGARRVFVVSVLMTAAGFAAIAAGVTVAGALVMLVFRGALASLGPATVVQALGEAQPVMAPLARMQAWRDLGAALGPLLTGYALAVTSAEALHGVLAACIPLVLVLWMRAAAPPASSR